MTTKTITSFYASFTFQNPYTALTITSTGVIGTRPDGGGVTGEANTQAYTVTNYGKVNGGVYLGTGGEVTNGSNNYSTASIVGSSSGVFIRNAVGAVANYGTIAALNAGAAAGVYLNHGGVVTNGDGVDTEATIRGGYGAWVRNAVGTVVNFGSILGGNAGDSGPGVLLSDGGVIRNGTGVDTAALIEGGKGLRVYNASGSVTNFGTILGVTAAGVFGVELDGGGAVTNGSATDHAALIEGYSAGVEIRVGGTISNFGTIAGEGDTNGAVAVYLYGGGLTNGSSGDHAALIEGYQGVEIASAPGTVANLGTILAVADSGYGLRLESGGSLSNGAISDTSALIEGANGLALRSGTATNLGLIEATGPSKSMGAFMDGTSPNLVNGAANQTSAFIEGYVGVNASAGATVTNFGTIEGEGGEAVTFSSITDLLNVEAGSRFIGGVAAGGGTVNLASGTGAISGMAAGNMVVSGAIAATTFAKVGTLEIAKGASFTAANASIASSQHLIDYGALTLTGTTTNANLLYVASGGTVVAAALVNNFQVYVVGALTVTGAVSGTGFVRIAGGIADFGSSLAQNVTFLTKGELELAKSVTFTGTITGFATTSATSLDLLDIAFGSGTKATYSGTTSSGTLTVTDGTHTAHIKFSGNYTGSTFTVSSDGHGGTKVVDPPATSGAHTVPVAPPHAFVAAMAAFGAAPGAGAMAFAAGFWPEARRDLALPTGSKA